MPVKHRIFRELDLVESVWTGTVTLEESLEHNASLRADPRFHAAMRQLSDARGAKSAVSAAGVRALAKSSPFGPAARRAIVASDDETFGVSRMYEAQADEAGEVRIFRDRDEALAWLGVDAAQLQDPSLPSG